MPSNQSFTSSGRDTFGEFQAGVRGELEVTGCRDCIRISSFLSSLWFFLCKSTFTHFLFLSPVYSAVNSTAIDCGVLLSNGSGAYDWLSPEEAESERHNCMFKALIPRWLHELQSCKEDFPKGGRVVYSAVSMFIQYLLPTITISVAYYQASSSFLS